MFSTEQKAKLEAALSKSNVRGRKQGGREVSYIEGWKVIEEANRIFGFDSWTRETIDIRPVAECEREVGKEKRPGWGVSYVCKVKVIVFAGDTLVTREGVGAGHGIDVDLGQAHESAVKEAETDAMKRALMTFGNPFGLALYDKEQANVAEEETPKARYLADCNITITNAIDPAALLAWFNSDTEKQKRRFANLSQAEVDILKSAVIARKEILERKTA
jgi:DNA repair and recombination protein RAD52